MERNIQLNIKNAQGGYDLLFPKTKAELVAGLAQLLTGKVDVVAGMGLSSNDFTSLEKSKLAGVEAGAQVNTVLSVAGRMGDIVLTASDVGLANVENKTSADIRSEIVPDDIYNGLGYTPENVLNKNAANGYVGLDANGKIPVAQLPDVSQEHTYIVADSVARLTITGLKAADKCFETISGDSYIYDGTQWVIMADADWKNVNLQWTNIVGGPTAAPADIDDSVSKRHGHTNKTVIDKITESSANASYDLSKMSVEGHHHSPDQIDETTDKQFVSATQKAGWDAKVGVVVSATQPDAAAQVQGDLWFQEV